MGVAILYTVPQVEGIVGTFIANIKDPASQYGSTVISYDKGGNWASLRPPTVDRNGAFLNCQPVSQSCDLDHTYSYIMYVCM